MEVAAEAVCDDRSGLEAVDDFPVHLEGFGSSIICTIRE